VDEKGWEQHIHHVFPEPVVRHGGHARREKTYPFFVVANGKASIPLGYLKNCDSFQEDSARAKIVSRFGEAMGYKVVVTSLAADIRLSLGEIADPVKRGQFLEVVQRAVDQLRAA